MAQAFSASAITRYLEFSLPYRLLLARRMVPRRWDGVLDALAEPTPGTAALRSSFS